MLKPLPLCKEVVQMNPIKSPADEASKNTTIVDNANQPMIMAGMDFIVVSSINAWWKIHGR